MIDKVKDVIEQIDEFFGAAGTKTKGCEKCEKEKKQCSDCKEEERKFGQGW